MRLLRRLVVTGHSMRPALVPGDRVVVVRRRPRCGDVVALRDPRDASRVVVKRLTSSTTTGAWVQGDLLQASTDSRHFGEVPWSLVLGRVVYRYAPAERAGLIPGPPPAPAATAADQRPPQGPRYHRTMPSERLDRVLADDYCAGIEELSTDEVRARRAECQGVEVGLSYARRLVQGNLDIIHAELERRRAGEGPSDARTLVDRLRDGAILSDHSRPPGFGRLSTLLAPTESAEEFTAEIDDVLDACELVKLPELTDDVVETLADRLTTLERSLSDRRRKVFDRIDDFQIEIVRRYKSGSANTDELLP